MSRLLVVGVPRSGTTWIGRTLGHTEGAAYVHEPDGDHDAFSFRAKRGRFVNPMLAPDEAAPGYERLWAGAFAGGRETRTLRSRAARRLYQGVPARERWQAWLGGPVSPRLRLVCALAVPLGPDPAARNVIVKSVRAEFAVEWVWRHFTPRVLVVERNPLNVLASWTDLGYGHDPRASAAVASYGRDRWGVAPPEPEASRLAHQAYFYGVLTCALRDAAARHPDWTTVTHEHLCVDTTARFAELASDLDLRWGPAAERFLAESDREGHGYETKRRAEEQPDRWQQRLEPDAVRVITETLGRFPRPLLP